MITVLQPGLLTTLQDEGRLGYQKYGVPVAGAMDSLPGHRAQKLAVYESALDGEQGRRKSTIAGQISLFALEGVEAPRPRLPDLPELPQRALLQYEKEMTGVYITGHPLDEYRAVLEKQPFNVAMVEEMAAEPDWEKYDRTPLALTGMAVQIRVSTTRNNKLMAFVTLEDLYGAMECLVFPKVYERLGGLLQEDAVLTMAGTLSLREDEAPKLLVESAHAVPAPGAQAHRERPQRFYVKVDDRTLLPLVQNLLRQHGGRRDAHIPLGIQVGPSSPVHRGVKVPGDVHSKAGR